MLVATKYVAAEHLGVLAEAGVRLIGENRAQDLAEKHDLYGDVFEYHFIGHLQSRKTRLVLPLVSLIHSRGQHERGTGDTGHGPRTPQTCCSRSTSPAKTRRAASPSGTWTRSWTRPPCCDRVRFRGLMCMPPLTADPEDARPYFARTRELGERLSAAWQGTYTFEQLSMGTSADYEVAAQEGATIVRVGSVLF